jgi:hypothetical protein
VFRLDFAVIGCRKSATTWLYENLSVHPNICVPLKVKETHFYSRYFDRGLQWYERFFIHHSGSQLCGEVDPELILCSEAAERLYLHWPQIKLIAIFRNPAEQFFSSYMHAFRKGDVKETPETVWKTERAFRCETEYASNLHSYLQRFPPEQILILIFEDLSQDVKGFYRQILSFLNAEHVLDHDSLYKKLNLSRLSRFPSLSSSLYRIARWARSRDLHWTVNLIKSLGIERLVTRQMLNDEEYRLSQDLRNEIIQTCFTEIEQLSRYTGRDLLSLWR